MSFQDRLDDLEQWYFQNITPIWIVVGLTAVVCLVVYSGLFFGIRDLVNLASDESVVSIADGCVNDRGLVKSNAPRSCFEPLPYPGIAVKDTTASPATTVSKSVDLSYDPPCGPKSDEHVCTDSIYRKTKITGTIASVEFVHATADANEGTLDHKIPDYTTVEYDPCGGDECKNETVNFCGNVLEQYNPGRKLSMILKNSTLSDYDKCYTVYPVDLTYGGKPLSWKPAANRSKVPGFAVPDRDKDSKDCEHESGGTCG